MTTRVLAVINGVLTKDLSQLPEADLAAALEQSTMTAFASERIGETIEHHPARDGKPERWRNGGVDLDGDGIPDEFELPGGKRLQRPGGKTNPHKTGPNGKEVKAKWRLQSTNPISPSKKQRTGGM